MFTKRTLKNYIRKTAAHFPVLLLAGPRQVGKTTLLEHCSKPGLNYVSLDNLSTRQMAQNDPELFLKRHRPPLIIDEIQYAPELFPYIKIEVDRQKKNGLFWLTGSQQFHLMRNVSESLAGRVAILNLLGLSLKEQQHKATHTVPFLPTESYIKAQAAASKMLTLEELYQKIWLGSFPALYKDKGISHHIFYDSYIQTYIQRDVRDLTHIGNETSFMQFIRAAAARSGNLLNLADLARDAEIDPKTAKSWLSILETSGLVYLLEPYHSNRTKRLIKAPKLYFLDTGLCSYLLRWTSPETLEAGAFSGAILESFILSEIIKTYWHNGTKGQFTFYRDKDGKEIDLLIEENGMLYPIEFKKNTNPDRQSIKHFKRLNKLDLPVAEGAVICLSDTHFPISEQVQAMPVWYL